MKTKERAKQKTTKNHYQTAVDFYNNKQIPLAKKHARQYLKKNRNDIPSLKLLAIIHYQSKQYTEALQYLQRIINIDENIAEINNLIGAILLESSDYQQSVAFFIKSIENDASYLDAYLNLASAFQKCNQTLNACEVFEAALSVDPACTTILQHYTRVLCDINEFTKAISLYQQWLQQDKGSAQANTGLARCYLALGKKQQVMDLLKSLKNSADGYPLVRLDVSNELLQSDNPALAIDAYLDLMGDISAKEAVYNNIASAYDHMEDSDKAIEYLLKSISVNKNYVAARSNLGRIYTELFQFENAEEQLRTALKIDPNNVNTLINLSRLESLRNKPDLAKQYITKAIDNEPNNAVAHYNLGNTYQQMGEFKKSCLSYRTCLSLSPDYSDAEQNLGINELALGKFDSAWGHYFKRIRNLERGEKLSPITPGMSLAGKHVYFCRSQGIGDELFFLRFLPQLKKQNLKITYRASKKIYPLLLQINEIDNLLDEDADIPQCDYYFTVDDLPLILDINDISKIVTPLKLSADKERIEKIKQILRHFPPPYTGITWRAGTQGIKDIKKTNQRNLDKLFPISNFRKITTTLTGSLVILQRNPTEKELSQFHAITKRPVVDMSSYNESLEDMLALLSLIDNYIGVSNTNMHLLAALEKTAEVLVPFPPDWRWMREGNLTPWFPEFGIYRQEKDGGWENAINKLVEKLSS